MDDLHLKIKFAKALFSNKGNAHAAAFELFSSDIGKALKVANTWPSDFEVIAELNALRDSFTPEDAIRRTKEEMCDYLVQIARNDKIWPSDRIKAINTWAVLNGQISEKETQKDSKSVYKVMKISKTSNDWENGLKQQQKFLIESGNANVA
jgi:hypothetical protein